MGTSFVKGVLHTTGGYMVYTATTFKYAFDYKPTDVYWYAKDTFIDYSNYLVKDMQ